MTRRAASEDDRTELQSKRRSEVVTVRLDPRLKYLAEVAARKQRRTLSGYIEWAVEQSLGRVRLLESEDGYSVEDAEKAWHLWDVDESERVVKLALHFPELLTYEEQLIWRLVRDCGLVWTGHYGAGTAGKFEWFVDEKNLQWDRVREHWDTFKKVAANALPREKLPSWQKFRPKQETTREASGPSWDAPKGGGDLDDEIPF